MKSLLPTLIGLTVFSVVLTACEPTTGATSSTAAPTAVPAKQDDSMAPAGSTMQGDSMMKDDAMTTDGAMTTDESMMKDDSMAPTGSMTDDDAMTSDEAMSGGGAMEKTEPAPGTVAGSN